MKMITKEFGNDYWLILQHLLSSCKYDRVSSIPLCLGNQVHSLPQLKIACMHVFVQAARICIHKWHPDINVVSRSKLQTAKPTKYISTTWLDIIKRGMVASNVIKRTTKPLLALLKAVTDYAAINKLQLAEQSSYVEQK
uniref:Uncharacterized protein n=1 Tax=Glossina brevipalpis TaxID=37001 RepID=A0A1A9X5E1_9MUSC